MRTAIAPLSSQHHPSYLLFYPDRNKYSTLLCFFYYRFLPSPSLGAPAPCMHCGWCPDRSSTLTFLIPSNLLFYPDRDISTIANIFNLPILTSCPHALPFPPFYVPSSRFSYSFYNPYSLFTLKTLFDYHLFSSLSTGLCQVAKKDWASEGVFPGPQSTEKMSESTDNLPLRPIFAILR